MKIKVGKEVTKDPEFRNKYVIEVNFMHGDADSFSTEEYICDDEEDCKRAIQSIKRAPSSPGSGGDEDIYREWGVETFNDDCFVPYDVTGYDCEAAFDGFSVFFYNEAGAKFKVEIEE